MYVYVRICICIYIYTYIYIYVCMYYLNHFSYVFVNKNLLLGS